MALVHYKGPYSMRTACGRTWKMKSQTTERPSEVTCPRCQEALARSREANKDLGNYTIKDDMVGTAKIRRGEGTVRVSVGYLKQLVEKTLKRPGKKAAPKKVPPSSLMKQVTSALHTLGYVVTSREKTMGAMKAWMDLPKHLRPKREPEPDTSAMSDEEFEKHLAARDAAYDAQASAPPAKEKSPGRIAMPFKRALKASGLETTVSGDRYETVLRGKGFEVILPPEGGGDIGADVFVKVFAGKYARDEMMGIDTGDYALGEGTLREYVEMPLADLEKRIAAMGPDDVADDDYVDSDTGEIYLEKGHKARTSALHPEYVRDRAARAAADREARRLEDEQWAKEDAEWEAEQERSRQESQKAFDAAVREYAGNWTDWRKSMGDEEVEEQSVAMDAADGFFYQFPDWKRWAAELGMRKADIKSMVADFVYEAIITGRVDF